MDFSYLFFGEVFYYHYYLQNELLHDSIPLIWKYTLLFVIGYITSFCPLFPHWRGKYKF